VNTAKPQKVFSDYLHHSNKGALMKKLHELLDGKKGKYAATIIRALKECGYLVGYESYNKLYESMKTEFGEIGNISGINSFLNESNKCYLKKEDIAPTINILKTLK
jgi:hypothetical protein